MSHLDPYAFIICGAIIMCWDITVLSGCQFIEHSSLLW